jgi:apolipoprotein D and lipocalin family protein
MSNTKKLLALTMLCVMLSSCASSSGPPIALVPQVDLQHFMGDWYVIAAIPTAIEGEAYNAVESYRLDDNGTIATTFTFRNGGFDGPLKTYTPRGFVVENSGNALWGMQFIWPIKAEYRIVYLAQDYSRTIIARNARDYLWIMARTPALSEAQYRELVEFVGAQDYDLKKLRKVPQRWPAIQANDVGLNQGDKQ